MASAAAAEAPQSKRQRVAVGPVAPIARRATVPVLLAAAAPAPVAPVAPIPSVAPVPPVALVPPVAPAPVGPARLDLGNQPGPFAPLGLESNFFDVSVADFLHDEDCWDVDGVMALDVSHTWPLDAKLGPLWTLSDRPEQYSRDSPGGLRITSEPAQLYIHSCETWVGNLADSLTVIQDELCQQLENRSTAKLFLTPFAATAGPPGQTNQLSNQPTNKQTKYLHN